MTNEQIIKLIPSKTIRDYLTKINWQFSERDKDILYRYLKLNEEPSFEDDYVPIPYPFRSGDIVQEIGKKELGVLSRYKDDEAFYEDFNRFKTYDCLDWTDTGCTRIDFLAENGKFYHTHINAIFLEYAEIPKGTAKDIPEAYYRTSIQIASNFIRGTENSIEDLQMCCETYAKSCNESRKNCCFCDSVFDGEGNSTWPIYYKEDGEIHRCCDKCNEKYVIAARKDHSLIMQLRNQFGIDYTEYQE